MKKSIVNIIFLTIVLCLLVGILIYPNVSINSASEGLLTWFNIVIPSLLPFFIVAEILINIGFVKFVGKILEPLMKPLFNVSGVGAFSLSMSMISGYPMGAKVVSNLREKKMISKIEAERMVSFSSTSGPLFMLGAISIGMLNNPTLGKLIIYPHYLGAITVGFLFRFYKKRNKNASIQNKLSPPLFNKEKINHSIGTILANSVKNGMNTIILIGGFMIFYSVLTELLFVSKSFNIVIDSINKLIPIKINKEILKGFIAGILEVTTGCKKISMVNMNIMYKIAIINFLIGWSGFSIHSQALSFIGNTDISGGLYVFSKFLHGIFSCFYSFVLYKLRFKNLITPSFSPGIYTPDFMYFLEWPTVFIHSIKLAILMAVYILICSLIMVLIYSIFPDD